MRESRRIGDHFSTTPRDVIDWYLNVLWVERRKCLLLTHAGTLFSVFVPDVRAADLRPIGPYVARSVAEALQDEALPADCLGVLGADRVEVSRTADRRVLGVMNDLALHAKIEIAATGGLRGCDIAALNGRLRRTLHNRDGYARGDDARCAATERGHLTFMRGARTPVCQAEVRHRR